MIWESKFLSWERKAHWLLLWKVGIWDHFQWNSWRQKRIYAQILKSGDVWSISFLTDHCNDHKSPFSIGVALDGTKCTLNSIGYLTKQTNRNWSDCWDLKQRLSGIKQACHLLGCNRREDSRSGWEKKTPGDNTHVTLLCKEDT